MGINQQKKAIIKQRLTSSVSIFFTSPYFIIKIVPRAAIPTTTIDQPTINHLKKSDKIDPHAKHCIPNVKFQMKFKRSNTNISIFCCFNFEITFISFEL
jgi:hypothetical protein